MNIYVISACWWRDGATVIGAGVDLSVAMALGDRNDESDSDYDRRITGWSDWSASEPTRAGRFTVWRRDALTAEGIHPSLYQEIVCVPLAGYAERPVMDAGPAPWAQPRHDVMADIRDIGKAFGAP